MISPRPSRGRKSPSWARNTRTGSSITSKRSISASFEQRRQALQRDVQPVGAVVLLVAQLVEHLLHLGEAQQPAHVVEALIQAATCGRLGVGLDERFTGLFFPF